ncbi:carboxylesterase 5A-like [Paramacrobiotus metropolitanus]|uniref:carboxylesterase 5A-like n=1 Tax=Paramacrobiotus metropolitanus TaxID=2943436 RepID=UPI002445BCFC|nr:carboxylesterase 5A-like [Paramacrobiotus metropolitanus]
MTFFGTSIFSLSFAALILRLNATSFSTNFVDLAPGVRLAGERYTAPSSSNFGYAYYGIRYGTAKRFEHSVENTDFSYLSDTYRRPQGFICPQRGYISFGSTIADLRPFNRTDAMNEDCLYLDIYAPESSDNKSLPVMVYYFGGSLQIGDKDIYNGSSLALHTDTILVVVNYRLSVFGFLSSGDEALPGNYGLGDCKTALKWVAKNIARFDGDPQRITVFGQSAGAILVSALYMDPDARKDIKAGIAISGSALLPQAWTGDPLGNLQQLAQKTGCGTNTTAADRIVQCLKGVPMFDLLAAAKGLDNQFTEAIPYAFVIDHRHFNSTPDEQIRQQVWPGATLLTGYAREDSSILLSNNNPQFFDPAFPLTWTVLRDTLAQAYLPSNEFCSQPKYALADQVMQHYNISPTDDRNTMLWKYYHLTTDGNLGYPALKETWLYVDKQASDGRPNQVYRNAYDQKQANLGAFHAAELGYIFGDAVNRRIFNLTLNPTVENSIQQMLWQVAYNGRMDAPFNSFDWRYMELGGEGLWAEGSADLRAVYDFWDAVARTPCNGTLPLSKRVPKAEGLIDLLSALPLISSLFNNP